MSHLITWVGPLTALSSETVKGLPPFVIAAVTDAITGNGEQRFRIIDVQFNLLDPDPLALQPSSRIEVFAPFAFVERRPDGALLFNHLSSSSPDPLEKPSVFAWIVEQERVTPARHLAIWRLTLFDPSEAAYTRSPA